MLEAAVLSISRIVRENCAEFIRHVHGSHVVRTLLHTLAGCLGPPRTESRPGTPPQPRCISFHPQGHFQFPWCVFCFQGAKERHAKVPLTDFEIPTSFWYELKNLTDTLMDNVNGG